MTKSNKHNRKSSIYTDKKGFNYYQTYSFFGSKDGLKKKIQKNLGKEKTSSQLKHEKEYWDNYYSCELLVPQNLCHLTDLAHALLYCSC